MDQFYTPPGLAGLLVNASRVQRPGIVADFAMGDGALLRAAQGRWSRANLFGSDIDPNAIASVSGISGKLNSAVYDFLSDEPAPEHLHGILGHCDVVLLNPPFTCRGNQRYSVELQGKAHRGSKALAFVAKALEFLSPKGEALAIIPASCLTSERDRELLAALSDDYGLEQIGEIARNAFTGCSVSVVIVRLRRMAAGRQAKAYREMEKPVVVRSYSAEVMRGSLPVERANRRPGDIPFIHTSDLKEERLEGSGKGVATALRSVQGKVVLLPRVGRPSRSKLALVDVSLATLSDCIVALRTVPAGHEDELHRLLKANWSSVAAAYGGSCAPYLTVERIRELLRRLGVMSKTVTDMRAYDATRNCRPVAAKIVGR